MFTKTFEFAHFFRTLSSDALWVNTINSDDDPSGILYRKVPAPNEDLISFQLILRGCSDVMISTEHRHWVNVDWKLIFNHGSRFARVKSDWRLAQITIPANQQIPFYLICNNKAYSTFNTNQDGILIYLDKEHPANWMDCDAFLIMEDSTEDVETLLDRKSVV